MISAIVVATRRGEVVALRQYRSDVSPGELGQIAREAATRTDDRQPPLLLLPAKGITVLRCAAADTVWLLATRSNANAALLVVFLLRLMHVFHALSGSRARAVSETLIRDHQALLYELLDEVADFGYPQIVDADFLSQYITQGESRRQVAAVAKKTLDRAASQELSDLTLQVTGSCGSWRPNNLKYHTNEAYLDVVEYLNLQYNKTGTLLQADVKGVIQMRSRLSGVPECRFGLNDTLSAAASAAAAAAAADDRERTYPPSGRPGGPSPIVLDDIRLHPCVRLGNFAKDHSISFVPPDGTFQLVNYRVTESIQIPLELTPTLVQRGRLRAEYTLQLRARLPKNMFASSILVKLPCPPNTAGITFREVTAGKAIFDSSAACVFWRVRRLAGSAEASLRAEAEQVTFVDAAGSADAGVGDAAEAGGVGGAGGAGGGGGFGGCGFADWARPPVTVDFQVPMFASSGLAVRYLRIEEDYKPITWIRYVTYAGCIEHRIY